MAGSLIYIVGLYSHVAGNRIYVGFCGHVTDSQIYIAMSSFVVV